MRDEPGDDVADRPRLQVFLSYRREDSEAWTGRLYDALSHRLGEDSLFMDIDDIPLGLDFVEVLEERLERCDAILAVIGRTWASLADADGQARLQDPDDFVRLEIEEGLRRKIPLIPVLVDGASLPKRDQLPDSCVPLVRRMAVRLTHESFRGDIERIVRALEGIAGQAPSQPRPTQPPGSDDAASGERSAAEFGRSPTDDRPAQRSEPADAEEPARGKPHEIDPSCNQGRMLEDRGDMKGAEVAYRRADERGDAEGAYLLGRILEKRRAMKAAEAAYRRADERGNAAAAIHVGFFLRDREDFEGTEAAYRRADERGSAAGSYNLGSMLERRGDLAGAEEAYRRADERGSAAAATNLGWILERRGDLAGAEEAYRRAADRA